MLKKEKSQKLLKKRNDWDVFEEAEAKTVDFLKKNLSVPQK